MFIFCAAADVYAPIDGIPSTGGLGICGVCGMPGIAGIAGGVVKIRTSCLR